MLDLPHLLLQLLVVLAAARAAGAALRRLGQPAVIGEIVAGIALGPSLLGLAAPRAVDWLFPPATLVPLAALSQLGVLFFLFTVGLRLDLPTLRHKARAAVVVSQASIVVPFALGAALAPSLFPRLAGDQATPLSFTLFLGAAMSVTAFPVLARLIEERGLVGTRVGTLAIACAAVDDVTAWCILAAVVSVARGGGVLDAALSLGATAAIVAVAATLARPLLRRALAAPGGVTATHVSIAVGTGLAFALATEHAGVHALFGAFLAGAVVPRERGVAASVADRLEAVVGVVLLPIFFAYTGLRTSLALVSGGELWLITALIVAVAVAGKLGGSALATRATGAPWREALAVGTLMNTRGLMELVILGVGLEIGVISPTLYAMMVVMAVVTTAMTSPILGAITRGAERAARAALPSANAA
jgi:Kef-type K+ transport system membrane component KefB